MDEQIDIMDILDLMNGPCFCVRDGQIVRANQSASRMSFLEGSEIAPLMLTGKQEYAAFEGGTLYTTLQLDGKTFGASVHKMRSCDVFLLESDSDSSDFQVLSLAAQQLRESLSKILLTISQMLPDKKEDAEQKQIAVLNRGVYQMLRIVSNMADAGRKPRASQQQLIDIAAHFQEIFEKAAGLAAQAGITLTYKNTAENIITLADEQTLERAIMNLLSNSLKFTPQGGQIEATLSRQGRILYLSIRDSGSGIAEDVRNTVFTRYQRQPGIEDSRYGIGLGMVLVRTAAAQHGGTVLIEQPEQGGTRVTMTLAIRQNSGNTLRSPTLRVDYAGERDHGLLELSDALPAFLYEKE